MGAAAHIDDRMGVLPDGPIHRAQRLPLRLLRLQHVPGGGHPLRVVLAVQVDADHFPIALVIVVAAVCGPVVESVQEPVLQHPVASVLADVIVVDGQVLGLVGCNLLPRPADDGIRQRGKAPCGDPFHLRHIRSEGGSRRVWHTSGGIERRRQTQARLQRRHGRGIFQFVKPLHALLDPPPRRAALSGIASGGQQRIQRLPLHAAPGREAFLKIIGLRAADEQPRRDNAVRGGHSAPGLRFRPRQARQLQALIHQHQDVTVANVAGGVGQVAALRFGHLAQVPEQRLARRMLPALLPAAQAAFMYVVAGRQGEEVLGVALAVLAEQEHRLVLSHQFEGVGHLFAPLCLIVDLSLDQLVL